MRKVRTVLLHPEMCQRSSLAIAEDMLVAANRLARQYRLDLCFEVEILVPPGDLVSADLVVLPGLGLASEAELSRATQTPGFADLLSSFSNLPPKATLAAACSGVFALGCAGLLDGRRITTSWWLQPYMQQRFPKARFTNGPLLVEDGPLITAGAAFAQIDLMLLLVERYMGIALAEECRRYLLAEQRTSQLPYVSVAALVASDPQLQQAELFAQRHLGEALTTADLAQAAGMGLRSFARRLQRVAALTPIQFLQLLRVHEALRLARGQRLSGDEIAHRVGYSDATALRRVFLQHLGKSLEAFR